MHRILQLGDHFRASLFSCLALYLESHFLHFSFWYPHCVCVWIWLNPLPIHHAMAISGTGLLSSSSAKTLHYLCIFDLIFYAFYTNNLFSASNFIYTVCIPTRLSCTEVQATITFWDRCSKTQDQSTLFLLKSWLNLCNRQLVFLLHVGKPRFTDLVFSYFEEWNVV